MTPEEEKKKRVAQKNKECHERKKNERALLLARAKYFYLTAKNGPNGYTDLEKICTEAKETSVLLLCISGTCSSPEEARELLKEIAKLCKA